MVSIEIENLSKHFRVLNRREGLSGVIKDLFSRDYRIVKAVGNVSMKIFDGEVVGFLGPNGAGKSTTIKMMTGVLEPTDGKLLVNGRVPYKDRVKNVQNIGVVFGQRTQLWWALPVIESFKILKEIYRIDKKMYEENLDTFNELVDLKSLYSTPARFLSLGQRMLCDIAASFLHNPRTIFLDEPTIGLDVVVKSKIRSLIKELNERKNTTIILTTHDISDIEALCKRIIVIDKGCVIYDGDITNIKTMFGAYRTLKVTMENEESVVQNQPDGNIGSHMDMDIHNRSLFEQISNNVNRKFSCKQPIGLERCEDGWLSITINQNEAKLLDVLGYLMWEYPVKDAKIEEVETESIIKKIYEGELV